MVTFEQALRSIASEWPDYEIAPYGYETDRSWLLILLPQTLGGRVPAVSKTTGDIRWINENDDEYSQNLRAGDWPDERP